MKIYLVKESNRFVVYYETYEGIVREEFYSKEEASSKYGSSLIENDEAMISYLRENYVAQQLGSDFLANMPDPLEDDKVLDAIMDKVYTDPIFQVRALRVEEDVTTETKGITAKEYFDSLASLLNTILHNIDKLKDKYNCLNTEAAKSLKYYRDNPSKLIQVIQRMVTLDRKYFDNARDPEVIANRDLLSIFHHLINFHYEHVGAYDTKEFRTHYDQRIYLNCHNEGVLIKFLSEYAQECIKSGIQYDCKGVFNTHIRSNDTTILYSTNEDMKKRIRIIEDIMLRHPEWREAFMPPVYGTSKVGTGFYGICHKGLNANTYNDYFKSLCCKARDSLLIEILLKKGIITKDDPDYEQFVKFAELKGLEPSISSITSITIDGVATSKLAAKALSHLEDPEIQKELRKVPKEEFRRRAKLIHAINEGLDPELGVPVSINREMVEFYGYKKKEQRKKVPKIEEGLKKGTNKLSIETLKQILKDIIYRTKMDFDRNVSEIYESVYREIDGLDDSKVDAELLEKIKIMVDEYTNYKSIRRFRDLKDKSISKMNNLSFEIIDLAREKKLGKSKDLNNDGFVSVDEVIKELLVRLYKYELESNPEIPLEKGSMILLRVQLVKMLDQKKYDIELVEKAKDALNNYENNTDFLMKRLAMKQMDGITDELREINLHDKGEELINRRDRSTYKDAAVKLFINHHDKYKKLVQSLTENGYGTNADLNSCRTLGLSVFERMKSIKNEFFDMTQYELFREILNSISQVINQVVTSIITRQEFNKENLDKLQEITQNYKKN